MDVIDLAKARTKRAEELARAQEGLAQAQAEGEESRKLIGRLGALHAAVCWDVSKSLWYKHKKYAIDIHRGECRRAKAELRLSLKKGGMDAESIGRVMEQLSYSFWMMLDDLRREHDVAHGINPRAAEDAAFARLHRPWPTLCVLSSEAALAWLDTIENNGGRLSPRTRAELAVARTELALGHMLAEDTERMIDRLIRARWKQGHQMAWENKWPKIWAAQTESA